MSEPSGRPPIAVAFGALLGWMVVQLPFSLALGALYTQGQDLEPAALGAELERDLGFLGASALVSGAASVLVFVVACRLIGWTLFDAGVRHVRRFWPAVGWAALALMAYQAVAVAWGFVVELPKDGHTILTALDGDRSTAGVLFVAFAACVVAPIGEELLFRGVLFRSLLRFGPMVAALVSGAVFGLLHAGAAPGVTLAQLAALGVALAFVVWQTGSITPCIAMHMLVNAAGIGVGAGRTGRQEIAWALVLLAVSWTILWLITRMWPPARLIRAAPASERT